MSHPWMRDVQGLLRSEWSNLRRAVDEALRQQLLRQEEVLAQYFQGIQGLTEPPRPLEGSVSRPLLLSSPPGASSFMGLCSNRPSPEGDAGEILGLRGDVMPQPSPRDMGLQQVPSLVIGSGRWSNPEPRDLDSCGGRPSSSRGAARLRELSANIQQIAPKSGSDTSSGHSSQHQQQISPSTTSTIDPSLAAFQASLLEVDLSVKRIERLLQSQELKRDSEESMGSKEKESGSRARSKRLVTRFDSTASEVNLDSESSPDGFIPPWSRSGSHTSVRTSRASKIKNMSVADMLESSREDATSGVARRVLIKYFGDWIRYWDTITEPKRYGRLAHIVNGRPFDFCCAFIIILNACFTWISTDYEIENFTNSKMTPAMDIIEKMFVTWYVIELTMKIAVHRFYFFVNEDMRWNIFDFLLVLFSLTDQVMSTASGSGGGADITFMRTLRVVKMAKILRGLRVVRFIDELRLILNSLSGSINSLMWSIVMLTLIFYMFGLVFVQGVSLHLAAHYEEMDANSLNSLMSTFGSVQNAMLSLFQSVAGGDDWSKFYETLSITGWPYALLFIFFIAFNQIAILNVLTAIFVNNAMELARPDADKMAMEQRKKDIEALEELTLLCSEIGSIETGKISLDDFTRHISRGRIGARLSVLGLNVTDADSFFELVGFTVGLTTSGYTEMAIPDFLEGCMRLRGAATGVGVQGVFQETRHLYQVLCSQHREQQRQFSILAEIIAPGSLRPPEALPPERAFSMDTL